MANEHPKFEDDVPQFSGESNANFIDWVADHKDETRYRFGHASTREDPFDSRSSSSRGSLGREISQTSPWTTSESPGHVRK